MTDEHTTTSYGTWNNRVDDLSLTVEQSVIAAVTDWADDYDIPAVVSAYRDAINAELPGDFSLVGDEFVGPVNWPHALDIKSWVNSVDLWDILADHEKGDQ